MQTVYPGIEGTWFECYFSNAIYMQGMEPRLFLKSTHSMHEITALCVWLGYAEETPTHPPIRKTSQNIPPWSEFLSQVPRHSAGFVGGTSF
jgi:hypothetical protein